MAEHVCPWWLGYLLTSPLRRFWQHPTKILGPYVREGMTVLEPGPGMGFFTLELARMVGPSGHVVAIDIQPKMLARLERRVTKHGLRERVEVRLAGADSLGVANLSGQVDLALAFAVVHELPSPAVFFAEIADALKPGAALLLAEPIAHLRPGQFADELKLAAQAGLPLTEQLSIRLTQAALLRKVS